MGGYYAKCEHCGWRGGPYMATDTVPVALDVHYAEQCAPYWDDAYARMVAETGEWERAEAELVRSGEWVDPPWVRAKAEQLQEFIQAMGE